jgi:hypothetical protein
MLFVPAIPALYACEDELLLTAEKIKDPYLANIHLDLPFSMGHCTKHRGPSQYCARAPARHHHARHASAWHRVQTV